MVFLAQVIAFFGAAQTAHAVPPAYCQTDWQYSPGPQPATTVNGSFRTDGGILGGNSPTLVVLAPGSVTIDYNTGGNRLGGVTARNTENQKILQVPTTPPMGLKIAENGVALPTPLNLVTPAACQFQVWQNQEVGVATTGINRNVLVVIFGQATAMQNSTIAIGTKVGNDVVLSSVPYADLKTELTGANGFPANTFPASVYAAEAASSAIPAGLVKRYYNLQFADGSNETPEFSVVSSKQGVIFHRIRFEAKRLNGESQAVSGPLRSTIYRPRIKFATNPISNVHVQECSNSPLQLTVTDGAGTATNVIPPLAANEIPTGYAPPSNMFRVNLNGTATPATLYLDSACNYSTGTIGMANPAIPSNPAPNTRPSEYQGTGTANFYYKTSASGSLTIGWDHSNNPKFNISQEQNVLPAIPSVLRLTGPASVNQSECSPSFLLQMIDAFGNETSPSAGSVEVTLTQNGNAQFFSNSACTTPIAANKITFPNGTSRATFYVKDTVPQQVLIGSGATGINPAPSITLAVMYNGLIAIPPTQEAGRQLAMRVWNRLVGVPIDSTDPRMVQMTSLIMQGRGLDAAHIATNEPNFYDLTVRSFATPMSNRILDPLYPLNDFVTTVIGTVYNGRDAREFLTGNTVYVPRQSGGPVDGYGNACAPAGMYKNNQVWNTLESQGNGIATNIVPARQCAFSQPDDFSNYNPTPLMDTAGLLTTRTFLGNHAFMGTNRRMVEFAYEIFMCKSMRELSDTSAPDWRIRQDVDRVPAGQAALFNATCKGCHSGMDAAAGAFAFIDYYNKQGSASDPSAGGSTDARPFYSVSGYSTGNPTRPWKMRINSSIFPPGYATTGDDWLNFFTEGKNESLGWDQNTPTQGSGMNSFGRMLANSRAFSSCMSRRVYKEICKRAPGDDDAPVTTMLTNEFIASGYNTRRLFELVSTLQGCVGNGQ